MRFQFLCTYNYIFVFLQCTYLSLMHDMYNVYTMKYFLNYIITCHYQNYILCKVLHRVIKMYYSPSYLELFSTVHHRITLIILSILHFLESMLLYTCTYLETNYRTCHDIHTHTYVHVYVYNKYNLSLSLIYL